MIRETREERKTRQKEEVDKLTQETLDNMKRHSEQRAEARRERRSKLTLGGVLTTVSFVGAFVCVAIGVFSISNAKDKRLEVLNEIKDLEQQVSELQEQIDDISTEPIEKVYVIDTLNNASDLGNLVADGQNKYLELVRNNADGSELRSHAEEMQQYFTDASLRVQWYVADNIDYTWQFETNYKFSGESIPVIWTCYKDGTDELLAYATGVYNVAANQFSNVEYSSTLKGSEYSNAVATSNNQSVISSDNSVNDEELVDDVTDDVEDEVDIEAN